MVFSWYYKVSIFIETSVRFFKISSGPQTGWYADVPNHTLAENEMVAGSDTFLEAVDNMTDRDSEVHITCSDDNAAGSFLAKLVMKNHRETAIRKEISSMPRLTAT